MDNVKPNIYVAFYKGRKTWLDKLICFITRSKYSHCEIYVRTVEGSRVLYSSSPRDGGVRMKYLNKPLDLKKWELIPLDEKITHTKVKEFFTKTKGKKYDYIGAIASVVSIFKQNPNRYFCSEWVAKCLEIYKPKPHRLTPKKLFTLLEKQGEKLVK